MPDRPGDFWGKPIFSYSRAQAIADGVLVDLTSATDENGQRLCPSYGFKVPVAITRSAWARTIEAGGNWRPDGDGEVLELQGGQSLAGRLKDLLWMLRIACSSDPTCTDRVHFEVRVDVHGNARREVVKLWALCGPGDDAEPVITIMLEGED
jgi:hypothetical protein